MNIKPKTIMLSLAAGLMLGASAETHEVLSAVENAASRTVAALAADPRVKPIKKIAFVRLNLPDAKGGVALESNVSQVFETTLAAKPESFTFVTHASHADEWKLIDGIFDQASDFESYDPKTHPELNKLKLAEALLIGQAIDSKEEVRGNETETMVRIALRLIKVSTGEQLWGQVIEGRHLVKVDPVREIEDRVKGLLTFRNILYALGGFIVLIILLFLLRQMIRVR